MIPEQGRVFGRARLSPASPHMNESLAMRPSTDSQRPPAARRKPEAAIPKFRELRLSAVVAACAWPKRPAAKPRKSVHAMHSPRFEEG